MWENRFLWARLGKLYRKALSVNRAVTVREPLLNNAGPSIGGVGPA
jgi:hypothetical protein